MGVVAYIRVVDGEVELGTKIRMMASGKEFEVNGVGVFKPKMESTGKLTAGEVGYVTASMKNVGDTRVGDTITEAASPAAEALHGYREVRPMVFCGLYPIDSQQYNALRDALAKLQLNDAALTSSRRLRWRWGSVSDAGSWGCCTWTSCRRGWSGSSI